MTERRHPAEGMYKQCEAGPPYWRIIAHRYNRSTFHGGYQTSDYSQIRCLHCGWYWRTKAAYVSTLALATDDERTRTINDPKNWKPDSLRSSTG